MTYNLTLKSVYFLKIYKYMYHSTGCSVRNQYIPSIDLLKKIINKKNQTNVNKYKFFIGIRHHNDLNFLIDQLTNIITAHMQNTIFISASISPELLLLLPDELKNIAPYIYFSEHVVDPFNFGNYMLIVSTIINHPNIAYDYFIYHTSSEYYIKTFILPDNFNLVYTKNKEIADPNMIKLRYLDFCKTSWCWAKYLGICENTKKFFIEHNLMICCARTSGIIVPKYVMDDYISFIHQTKLYDRHNEFKSKMMAEILLPSFITSRWNLEQHNIPFQMPITKCFKDKQNQHRSVWLAKKNMNRDNYHCIKKCSKGSQLLQFAHRYYMDMMM